MRKHIKIVICLMLGLSVSLGYAESDYYSASYARMSYVNGDIFIQRAEDLGYEEGVVNLALVAGDKLGSRDGRAEVHFQNSNYLRIDKYTHLDLVQLPSRGYDQIKLHLLSGKIFLRINYLEREKDFEVHTPDASFYILEEGLYAFYSVGNERTEIRVFEGKAEAAGETGSLLVSAQESLEAANGIFLSNPAAFYDNFDDGFSEWNRSRDTFTNRPVARSYLPDELNEYEGELDYYGRWEYERPYGYVWVPRVYSSSWRPYNNGRWVWYPIIGWNWVSSEPWGWCVSHYGRWHWRLNLGWYWIPTRHWGPGWVHWYHGSSYYGWSPLSYYGYPGVIVNNHYYGRYNRGYYPGNSRALVVVHKNQLRSRNIAKVALSRNQVSRLNKISLSSRQPAVRASALKNHNSSAAGVMSRTKIRSVNKAYASGKSTAIRTRNRPSTVRGSSRLSSSASGKIRKNSTTVNSRTAVKRYSSSRSAVNQSKSSVRTPANRSSVNVRQIPRSSSRSSLKEYSSNRSRSTGVSSTRYRSSSSRSTATVPPYSSSSSSSKYRSSSRSRTPSRSYSTSSRSYSSSRAPSKSYSPRSSSSSRSRTPSRSYSSSSKSRSSSQSSSSRSTSRRSSSSSRSGSKVRKK